LQSWGIERDMHELGPHIVERACQIVQAAIGREHEMWPPLAESTIRDKQHPGFPTPAPLLRTGELRNSIEYVVRGNEGAVGSNLDIAVYSAGHNGQCSLFFRRHQPRRIPANLSSLWISFPAPRSIVGTMDGDWSSNSRSRSIRFLMLGGNSGSTLSDACSRSPISREIARL